jgi:hypothetical protein
MLPLGRLLTFTSVAVAMVFFRSPTLTSAMDLMKGLIGHNGVVLPQAVFDHLGPLAGWLHRGGVVNMDPELWSGQEFARMVIWIFASILIALTCPNTLQILARYEPALGVKPLAGKFADRRLIEWDPCIGWAIGMSIVTAMGIFFVGGQSEFLYWQF